MNMSGIITGSDPTTNKRRVWTSSGTMYGPPTNKGRVWTSSGTMYHRRSNKIYVGGAEVE